MRIDLSVFAASSVDGPVTVRLGMPEADRSHPAKHSTKSSGSGIDNRRCVTALTSDQFTHCQPQPNRPAVRTSRAIRRARQYGARHETPSASPGKMARPLVADHTVGAKNG